MLHFASSVTLIINEPKNYEFPIKYDVHVTKWLCNNDGGNDIVQNMILILFHTAKLK